MLHSLHLYRYGMIDLLSLEDTCLLVYHIIILAILIHCGS